MRLVQLKAGDVRRVAIVEEPRLRLLRDFDSVYSFGPGSHRERRGNSTSLAADQHSYG